MINCLTLLLVNKSFSNSHNIILEETDRIRVGNQVLNILKDWYGSEKNLQKLTVLDYGCSSGVITNQLSKYFTNTFGTDIDSSAIKIAKKKYNKKHISFLTTSSENLPFADNKFDLVISNQVYSYTNNPQTMMDEIYRVLKKGGVCLFTGDNLLRAIEPLYGLPFFRWIPKNIASKILKIHGYKNIYLGKYKTYWEIKKLFNKFNVTDYTVKILNNPDKYGYTNLYKYRNILRNIPKKLLSLLVVLSPSFVFVLKKN